MPEVKVDIVRGDSVGGANRLTKLLLDLGHRRIAVLSGPSYSSTARMRVDGYRQAIEAAGIAPEPEWVQFGEYTLESGYQMTERALSLDPQPTALLAANNSIAYGMLKALRDARLHVPEDISVVGYAYLPAETTEHPFLTVAEQSPSNMGRRASELLLARLAGQQLPPQEIVLPIKVVFRESCGPCSFA
jgi:DNA-binding LacI/PurR family transcriptional regulator